MKTVKAFLTDDRILTPSSNIVADVLEISDYSLTFSKERKTYTSILNSFFSLHVFKLEELTSLTSDEVNKIIKVVDEFINFLHSNSYTEKSIIISNFVFYLQSNTSLVVSEFDYNLLISYLGNNYPDYVTFTLDNDIKLNIWLRDALFREFYPHYDIDIVFPFENFETTFNNPNTFIENLNSFNLIDFNRRIEEKKESRISTYTKILNIPYNPPNTSVQINCYFAFIIYGQQGNYNHILKLYLFDYLRNTVGLSDIEIQNRFPTILQINEFFIVPRWLKIAIPSHVGDSAINSQITSAFNETFDINKFITIYDNDFLRLNTYNVPIEYNNMLLLVTNGKYTENNYKDFYNYFSDLVALTSLDPDFGRLSTKTQNLITLLENMVTVCNVNSSSELLNKVILNTNYRFTIINRGNIDYLSFYFDKHQYYMLPKYEYIRLNN